MKRVTALSSVFAYLANTWITRFPILNKIYTPLFVYCIIPSYWGAWAVGNSLKYKSHQDKIEIQEEIQENLAMVQRGIILTTYPVLINLLQSAANIQDLIEQATLYDETKAQQYKITSIIRKQIDEVFSTSFGKDGPILKILTKEANDIVEIHSNSKIVNSKISFQVPKKPHNAIWILCKNALDKNLKDWADDLMWYFKVNYLEIDQQIKENIREEFKELLTNLIQIKVYVILLKIDRFSFEEMLPGSIYRETEDKMKFRSKYEAFRKWEQIPAIKNITYSPYSLNKMSLDEVSNHLNSQEFSKYVNSKDYSDFMESFFTFSNRILMDMIADDTVVRIRELGRTIRFGVMIPFNESPDVIK
jgi:hypothetical protein